MGERADPVTFSSLPAADPQPWQHPVLLLRHRDPGFGAVYTPRPESGRSPRLPQNPVLAAYRRGEFPAGYWAYRLAKGDLPEAVTATQAHIDHAIPVLARLDRVRHS